MSHLRVGGEIPRLLVATFLYAVAYHFAYVTYISPEYEYAYVLYFEPTSIGLVSTYLLILAPLLAYRPAPTPVYYGAAVIFAIAYVPAQLFLLFNWQATTAELIGVQVSVAASMAVLFGAVSLGAEPKGSFDEVLTEPIQIYPAVTTTVGVITGVAVLLILYFYGSQLQIVDYEDIYEFRFRVSQYDYGPVVNYSMAWLGGMCMPFYFARAFLQRRALDLAVGVGLSLLVYAVMAFKFALLMGPFVYALLLLINSREQFLFRLLIVIVAILVVLIVLPYEDDGLLRFLRAVFYLRLLGTGGWSMSLYYDFFATNGFTYYTHIGPIGALTGAYPYGSLGLGQVIGLNYFGTEEANFNANFWASDGFAAFGVVGVGIATVGLCGVWYALNRSSRGFPTRFAVLWMCGFWQALLNAPITLALLSGGGLWIMVLMVAHSRWAGSAPPETQDEEAHRRSAFGTMW
jgi:hypothetical protein